MTRRWAKWPSSFIDPFRDLPSACTRSIFRRCRELDQLDQLGMVDMVGMVGQLGMVDQLDQLGMVGMVDMDDWTRRSTVTSSRRRQSRYISRPSSSTSRRNTLLSSSSTDGTLDLGNKGRRPPYPINCQLRRALNPSNSCSSCSSFSDGDHRGSVLNFYWSILATVTHSDHHTTLCRRAAYFVPWCSVPRKKVSLTT